jgi:superfamily II DNA or RNA helicase
MAEIKEGSILHGSWSENLRVISVKKMEGQVRINAVGCNTEKFYNLILTEEDMKGIEVVDESLMPGDGEETFLFLEAKRIRNNFQFDPLCAVNVSQIDPLPHQIDAVYYHILKNPRIRFLLADDPGAGKTIMAGLLLKELRYRGLVEKTLIVVPGHLKEQWLREMRERFSENFLIVDRNVMNASWGQNVFTERSNIIVSMDFAKQEDVRDALSSSRWDLCIVDEAHKMSAYKYGNKTDKSKRYSLGETLSDISNHLLFLTATPHRGDPENFRLLLDLLEPGLFANEKILSESIQNRDNPLVLRRLKEDLKDFDGKPLFPPRDVQTPTYNLSSEETELYNKMVKYVSTQFNRALKHDNRNVTFAMMILQRRLASSVYAVRKSLERRRKRLNDLYEKGDLIQKGSEYDEDYLEDLEEEERWNIEEEMLEKLTSAETLDELRGEIETLDELVELARRAEQEEVETKLNELKRVMEEMQGDKILIFTEFKDTLDYLVKKLKEWGYSVASIHGGMKMDERINAEHEFNYGDVQVMISTEAGGEGINLQRSCWLMVNYDIPWNPNRLEQRMGRIHRYGQKHEVHIFNMVAGNTIEGEILNRVFAKLQEIKRQLGSDRVFDVINDVLKDVSLKDLIMNAVANQRTLDDILKDIETIPDADAIQRVREAALEALATKHVDLSRVLSDQRKAKENRLAPEYVEEFFVRAARKLNIRMDKKGEAWQIYVPFDVRKNVSYDFRQKFGEVYKEYPKVSFSKERASQLQAEFVFIGHPLLEAVMEEVEKRFANRYAAFTDPDGRMDGLIRFMDVQVKDGKNEIAGKRLFAIYQDSKEFSYVNPSILWDLKPEGAESSISIENESIDNEGVMAFLVKGIGEYKRELLEVRERDAGIKRKYGLRSLKAMISQSEAKIAEYLGRRNRGENIPEATIENERRKKEDLLQKKKKLEEEIDRELHIFPSEPVVLGAIRVVPGKRQEEMVRDEEIERIGMETVMEYERKNGRIPEDVSSENLGYDIRSSSEDGREFRYIEVKARAGEGSIALTPNEWMMAQRFGKEYWLYVVVNAATEPELYILQDPATHLKPDEEVSIVRYIVKDWKEKAMVAE